MTHIVEVDKIVCTCRADNVFPLPMVSMWLSEKHNSNNTFRSAFSLIILKKIIFIDFNQMLFLRQQSEEDQCFQFLFKLQNHCRSCHLLYWWHALWLSQVIRKSDFDLHSKLFQGQMFHLQFNQFMLLTISIWVLKQEKHFQILIFYLLIIFYLFRCL